MPIVNAQLWQSLKISGQSVDLAVEKARSSRLEMVTQVKQAFYSALLAKEALDVYGSVYDNAVENFNKTESRYKVQKASELEYTRAKTAVANAIPNVYNAEGSVILALWQLKAIMGVDLDMDIDIVGSLGDYADTMFRDIREGEEVTLDYNSTMRQLAIQAEQLASTIRLQKYAYLPTLSATFSYSMNAMTNNFRFSEYKWTPYSFVFFRFYLPSLGAGLGWASNSMSSTFFPGGVMGITSSSSLMAHSRMKGPSVVSILWTASCNEERSVTAS